MNVLRGQSTLRGPPPSALRPPPPRRSPVWKSPLRPGKVKAYDEALKYIRQDALALRREIADLKASFQAHSASIVRAGGTVDEEELRRYREKLWVLDVQSEVNLPEVRYAFTTGRFPFQRPVYRHLTEQKWRHDGPLDLLMERLHQMHVIPDVVPTLHPTVDLRVQFPYAPPPPPPPELPHFAHHRRQRKRTVHERAREKQGFSTVEPGEYLAVSQTLNPPRITATMFHNDTRYYTLLLIDPDVPDPQNNAYTTFLHWMHPNIALSATRRIVRLPLPDHASPNLPSTSDPSTASPAVTPYLPYIPPHPHRGTGYHRYVLLLLPHPFARSSPLSSQLTSQRLDIPIPSDAERVGFSVRDFVSRWGIDLGSGVPPKGGVLGTGALMGGGGACMWRAVWEEGVTDIWRNVLGAPEPKYARPPKPDPYPALKTRSRYAV